CANVKTDKTVYVDLKFAQSCFQLYAATTDVTRLRVRFDSDVCLGWKKFGRLRDKLLINQHRAGHDQRLSFGARIREPAIDQEFVNALALHARNCSLDFSLSRPTQAKAYATLSACKTARGVSLKRSSAAHSRHSHTSTRGASAQ